MGGARTMRALALVVLLSMAANAQYPIQAEKGAKVKQSRLSELSPRAGPDRPKTASVPLSVLTPLTALGGLGRHVTASQEPQKTSHFIQPQIIGLRTDQIGSQVYSLPSGGAVLQQLQKPSVKGGYAVQEPPQEDAPEQTSKDYQFVFERLPSGKNQPIPVRQFNSPLTNQPYQNVPVQQSLPLFFNSPQQHSQRDQVLFSPPISFFQPAKEQDQEFSPRQQIYVEKPNANFIQTTSPIASTTVAPPTIHLASISSPSYPSSTEAAFPVLNKQNQELGLYKDGVTYDGVTYEVVNPLNYGNSPPYYSYALDNPQKTSAEGRFESVTPSFYQNQVPQTTTEKPLLPISRGFPVEYHPQISSSSANVGISRGIYDSNAALITIGSQNKDGITEPVGLLAYIQQPFLGAASSRDSNYNGNQGTFLRNPIEYASPFARQELLELRHKKGFS
ncbi:uncharacterized protein [Hetaerina americana]|uniref:uncharacterized protein n=1 Tax=Hetaerina americana TaxID=62018 RepID=UPI003A7F3893